MNPIFQIRTAGFRLVFMASLLTGLLFAGISCTPPPEAPQKAVVVRKKILTSQRPVATLTPAGTLKKGTGSKMRKPAAVQEKNKRDKNPGEKKPTAAAKKETAALDQFPELYKPEGKADPFQPFIKTKEEREKIKNRKKRIPRTPLEKVDISQIKLTAIVQSPAGNFGLVEEATGKGYVVTAGTFIGVNGGKIKRIFNDHMVVEEETEDLFGKRTTHEIVVKLHKPVGEF